MQESQRGASAWLPTDIWVVTVHCDRWPCYGTDGQSRRTGCLPGLSHTCPWPVLWPPHSSFCHCLFHVQEVWWSSTLCPQQAGLGSCLYRVVQLISGRQCTLRHLAGASGLRGMGQATLLVPRVALASFDYTQGLVWHGPEVVAQGLTPQNTM